MSTPIILHHYDASPYAEKIRLMFGLTNTPWKSLLSPARPPRPNLDPLTGGYRRIPVLQLGADIICDTALIAEEIAEITSNQKLQPQHLEGRALELVNRAEQEAFFSAIAAVPPLRLLTTMWMKLGPLQILPFIKDRKGMLEGGTKKAVHPKKAQHILAALIDDLESHLNHSTWIAGDLPSLADFSVYHVLWLHVSFNRKPLAAGPNVQRWYSSVSAIGQGPREEITQAEAFELASRALPRAVPSSDGHDSFKVGQSVSVSPEDYAVIPVHGELVSINSNRIILARDTSQFGLLHVHFPRSGYSIS